MKKLLFWLIFASFYTNFLFAQDVIIKKTGQIINAKVLEVGVDYLKYKRGDQTDGPVYTMPLHYVYAVSYADRTQDIFTVPDSTVLKDFLRKYDTIQTPSPWKSDRSYAYFGLGFIKDYTKVKTDGRSNNSAKIPFVFGGYAFEVLPALAVGVEVGYSNYGIDGTLIDQYNNFAADYSITESIFSFNLYGKKNFPINNKISPYLKIGFGINSSQIDLTSSLDLDERGRKNLTVQSAGNVIALGIIGRVGLDYYFNSSTGVFLDAGLGATLLQVGAVFAMPSPFKKKEKKTPPQEKPAE